MDPGEQRHGALGWLLARRPEREPATVAATESEELRSSRPRPSSTAPVEHERAQPVEEAEPAPERGLPPFWRKVRSLAIVALIVVAGAFLMRTYVVETYYIPSQSMEPTLHGCPGCNDDRVLVEKVSYLFHDPRPGDVVVFDRPGSGPWSRTVSEKVLIKRVIGVGGDRIVFRRGHVFRDGRRLIEPYVNPDCRRGTRAPHHVYRVPTGDVFVMGDNRCDSEDSRFNGPVPDADVVGRAFLIIWPVGRIQSL